MVIFATYFHYYFSIMMIVNDKIRRGTKINKNKSNNKRKST